MAAPCQSQVTIVRVDSARNPKQSRPFSLPALPYSARETEGAGVGPSRAVLTAPSEAALTLAAARVFGAGHAKFESPG